MTSDTQVLPERVDQPPCPPHRSFRIPDSVIPPPAPADVLQRQSMTTVMLALLKSDMLVIHMFQILYKQGWDDR